MNTPSPCDNKKAQAIVAITTRSIEEILLFQLNTLKTRTGKKRVRLVKKGWMTKRERGRGSFKVDIIISYNRQGIEIHPWMCWKRKNANKSESLVCITSIKDLVGHRITRKVLYILFQLREPLHPTDMTLVKDRCSHTKTRS